MVICLSAFSTSIRSVMLKAVSIFGTGVVFCAITLTLLYSPALANNLPNGQFTEQPATLVGPQPDTPIPLYLRPAANQPNVGYGINGSAVTITEQVASFLPEADQNSAWNHIRLDQPPYTEGWVQGRFLELQGVDTSATD